MQRVG